MPFMETGQLYHPMQVPSLSGTSHKSPAPVAAGKTKWAVLGVHAKQQGWAELGKPPNAGPHSRSQPVVYFCLTHLPPTPDIADGWRQGFSELLARPGWARGSLGGTSMTDFSWGGGGGRAWNSLFYLPLSIAEWWVGAKAPRSTKPSQAGLEGGGKIPLLQLLPADSRG